jgi:hypothetical protein
MLRISNLQISEPTTFGGLITEANNGYLLENKPQYASNLVEQIYKFDTSMDLHTRLSEFPIKYFKTDDVYRWKLMGPSEKNIPLLEARLTKNGSAIAPTDRPGLGASRFYLVFPEKYFFDTETIVGELNEKYMVRIMEEPIVEGGVNYVYEVEFQTNDASSWFPYEELQTGKRFSKEGATVERTESSRGSQDSYISPFEMENSFTYMRKELHAVGNMIDRPIQFTFTCPDGTTASTWTQYQDYIFEKNFRLERNRLLMFGQPSKTAQGTHLNKGKSGNFIETGAGLRAQMNPSNIAYYNKFSIKWLTDLLLGLSVNKLKEDQRKFVFKTGEWGMLEFSRALEDYAYGWTRVIETNVQNINRIVDNTRISMGANNKMTFKGQFMNLIGPNGIEVTVEHDASYDDLVRNKIMMPGNRGPAESHRFDILDIGTTNGEANICLTAPEGWSDIMGYIPGMRDPYSIGAKKPKMMVTSRDSYEYHRMSIFGTMIKNPTKCLQIIPSILA